MYILLWDEATRFPRFRLSSFVFYVFILLLPQFPKISSGIAYFLRHAQRRIYYNSNIDYNIFCNSFHIRPQAKDKHWIPFALHTLSLRPAD